jgi:sugar-specific transcriptional regulator TrmB
MAGVKRTSAYDILERLVKMGLVTLVIKNNRQKLYYAEPPEKIKNVLLKEKERINQKVEHLDQLMPELNSLFSQSGIVRPKIKFFEGQDEIKKILEDILMCQSKEYWYIGSRKKLDDFFGADYMKNYTKRRITAGIRIHSLRTSENLAEDQKTARDHKQELREIRFLPKDVNLYSVICAYDNKVAIFAFKKEVYGFIVESEELTRTFKTLLKLIWDEN